MSETSVIVADTVDDSDLPDAENAASGRAGDVSAAEAGEPKAADAVVPKGDSKSLAVEEKTSDTAERPGKSGRSWPRLVPRPLVGILLLLLVVATVFATVFGWKLETRNDRQASGAAALAAASDYAVALTSIDATHLDSSFATAMNGATGEFKDTYSKSADQLKPMLLQANSVSKGHVIAASVQSASADHAVIMLFVDAEITNTTNPAPRVDRNRILMTMDRVGGRWLASKVELP
ncbi:hypothetical protein [Nocardia sp. NPDC006630]|uniref:hypothetical protein n=1 Tax=Nocardia sp. NPDC006630 TaxID=3157181 RepID=UPI0033B84ADD